MNRITELRLPLILVSIVAIFFLPATALSAEADPDDVDQAEASTETTDEEKSNGEKVTMEEMLAEDEAYESEEESSNPGGSDDWTWRITRSAFWGGVTGALVGLGLFLIGGDRFDDGLIIAQLAGGGILIGAGLGLISVLTDGSSSNSNLEHPASLQWMERDMPRTYDLNIIYFEY